ncbi:sialidase family protein [Paenibacillus cymbidii]|uniref:sialidase family protein n=1 Tax=Paenibacillus cymbidii TaxID=1639034 RepID=UPI00108186B3|nr:sialidase family protein [Paenibacillus cymbidii]
MPDRKKDMAMEEWRRSGPDIVVFIPREDEYTGDNEHFLVFETPGGDLLALWTQSSVEGSGDNHLVVARSGDNVNWTEPAYVAGSLRGQRGNQASWGFPVVSAQGRIYIFYTKDIGLYDFDTQTCGAMGCVYSDNDGHTWTDGGIVPMPRNRYDHPDPAYPRNWIVWQKPVRDARGRWIAGCTQWASPLVAAEPPPGWYSKESRALFVRFDNIDEGPDPRELRLTWLPKDNDGLEVAYPGMPSLSVAQEPSVVLLPDGRLFSAMRTFTGHIWYSVSADDGDTWTKPDVLRYRDGGEPIKQPIASCPLYALGGGRYVLVFHNNDGRLGNYGPGDVLHNRRPAFLAVGTFDPAARQPLVFGEPKQLLDTDGVPIGPKGTAEIATYPSMTDYKGRRVLWYPDRKYYLLGKYVTDERLGLEGDAAR